MIVRLRERTLGVVLLSDASRGASREVLVGTVDISCRGMAAVTELDAGVCNSTTVLVAMSRDLAWYDSGTE